MKIRVIQMISNYYKDEKSVSTAEREERNIALGEYCCLGHFDAMHVELVEYVSGKSQRSIRAQVDETVAKGIRGRYNIRNIVCLTDDDEKDERFWKEAEKMPFLFLSLISLKHTEDGKIPYKPTELFERFKEINHSDIAYYTYDHSEIVVFRTGRSYVKGFEEVISLYDKMEILKMYTVVAVREDVLGECENIRDEDVECRLWTTVKNKTEIDGFKEKLAVALRKKSSEIKTFETLGNSDYLIEISKVSIRDILRCYQMGRLLTDSNQEYRKTFFNIESQLLVDRGWENGHMGD